MKTETVSRKQGKVGEAQMKSKLLRRGIEPIIAVVILVAVTLVIAIGVIGWLMGWWGSIGATESLIIYGDSKLTLQIGNTGSVTNVVVTLHVANKGSASAVIYKVEVVNVGEAIQFTIAPNNQVASLITLTPGGESIFTATMSLYPNANIVAGANYIIKVYTKAGNVYQITLVAQQG